MEWYEPEALKRQNQISGDIQPIRNYDLKSDLSTIEDTISISNLFPEFKEIPVIDEFFAIKITKRINGFLFLCPKLENSANLKMSEKHIQTLEKFEHDFQAMENSIQMEENEENVEESMIPILNHPYLGTFMNYVVEKIRDFLLPPSTFLSNVAIS